MAARPHECGLQRVQFTRGHADVNGANSVGVDQNTGVVEELAKGIAKCIVLDPPSPARLIGTSPTGVVDVIGWVAKSKVGFFVAKKLFDISDHRGIATKQAMVSKHPEITRSTDRILLWFGNFILAFCVGFLAEPRQ